MCDTRSFRTISLASLLAATQPAALQTLWRRAIDANHLAKITTTRAARNSAYHVKTAAVCQAIRIAPMGVLVSDYRLASQKIVGLYVDSIGGVHVPLDAMTTDVRPHIEAALELSISERRPVPIGVCASSEAA